MTKIPLASRFVRGGRLTEIPRASRFARGDKLTKISQPLVLLEVVSRPKFLKSLDRRGDRLK